MRRCTPITAAIAAAVFVALPLSASAQSFRCTGKDGRRYYGQVVPRECIGRPYEQLNQQGLVIKRIEPFVEVEDPAVKAAEERKKREQEQARREEARRARALLATYTSVKEIEGARARALAPVRREIDNIETDIAGLKKQIAKFKGTKDPQSQSNVESAQSQIETQQSLLDYKKKEAAGINARYDSDRTLYLKLTGGK
jgi:hypothetical protein